MNKEHLTKRNTYKRGKELLFSDLSPEESDQPLIVPDSAPTPENILIIKEDTAEELLKLNRLTPTQIDAINEMLDQPDPLVPKADVNARQSGVIRSRLFRARKQLNKQ